MDIEAWGASLWGCKQSDTTEWLTQSAELNGPSNTLCKSQIHFLSEQSSDPQHIGVLPIRLSGRRGSLRKRMQRCWVHVSPTPLPLLLAESRARQSTCVCVCVCEKNSKTSLDNTPWNHGDVWWADPESECALECSPFLAPSKSWTQFLRWEFCPSSAPWSQSCSCFTEQKPRCVPGCTPCGSSGGESVPDFVWLLMAAGISGLEATPLPSALCMNNLPLPSPYWGYVWLHLALIW